MNGKTFAWLGMTLLALAVAAYATVLLVVPEFRPPLVRDLFATRPLTAFAHFLGGAIALVAGAFQLNAGLRNRYIGIHRWLGRLYLLAIAMGGIAGLAMALQSFGGLFAHLGFGLMAILWLATTFNAYRHIRNGNIPRHRSWMIRSYALTLAAVTLRIYLPSSQLAGLSMPIVYPIIAWLCWVPNLVVAEWFIRGNGPFTSAELASGSGADARA